MTVASADSTLPEPSMSPGRTRTYTCGTSTCCVEPSARVTVCSTSQTMSLVSCAICAAVRAMPGRSRYCCAKRAPAFISAVYWVSSLA